MTRFRFELMRLDACDPGATLSNSRFLLQREEQKENSSYSFVPSSSTSSTNSIVISTGFLAFEPAI